MRTNLIISLLIAPALLSAQGTYFPPTTGPTWETTDPASLGWCMDELPPLLDFLEESNSKGFIVLKDGRIVIEEYFGTFTQDSIWYWASAGKSLTAFLVGLAQQDGLLDIDEPSSTYLGEGWTSCTPQQEAAITVRHQLTMTTGLDDTTGDLDCTDPECLQYLAEPDTRWAYYNAPYTKLDGVITGATGQNLNGYVYNELGQTIGLLGLYLPIGYNNVFFSTPRVMARFGLLAMSGGSWDGVPILTDAGYFSAMTTSSQALNPAYGYLWWLNGQEDFMLPGLQVSFPGSLMPNAPQEAYSAMGKNGQIVNVIPSEGLVVVRMGDLPGGIFVPNVYNNDIWERLNAVICTSTGTGDRNATQGTAFPNPTNGRVHLADTDTGMAEVVAADGRLTHLPILNGNMDLSTLSTGVYLVRTPNARGGMTAHRVVLSAREQ